MPAMEREAVPKRGVRFSLIESSALIYDCCAADRGQARSYALRAESQPSVLRDSAAAKATPTENAISHTI